MGSVSVLECTPCHHKCSISGRRKIEPRVKINPTQKLQTTSPRMTYPNPNLVWHVNQQTYLSGNILVNSGGHGGAADPDQHQHRQDECCG